MDAKVSSWACTLSKYSVKALDCATMLYTLGSALLVLAGVHKYLKSATKGMCICCYMFVCVVCVCVYMNFRFLYYTMKDWMVWYA